MTKVFTKASEPKEKSKFLAGAGVFAVITAIGSTMGEIGGALGSALGGYLGSRVAQGKSEKFIISGLGYINAVDFLVKGLVGREVII